MQQYWGYDLHHITSPFSRSALLKPLDYSIKAFKSAFLLLTRRPSTIWLQLPPSILLYIAFLFKLLINPKVKIVVDAHNSLMRGKWFNLPFIKILLNRADVFLAHNVNAAEQFFDLGIQRERIKVLEDLPFTFDVTLSSTGIRRTLAVCPCSFDIDEPIGILFDAFRMLDCELMITGDVSKLSNELKDLAPPNVTFTGFLPKIAYEELICGNSIIVGLTTRDDVQLSVANEGLSACRPLVLSDTITLRKLYGHSALFFSNSSPDQLASAIRHALANYDDLVQKSQELRDLRIAQWEQQAKSTGI
jgi:hypothetical protein